MESPVPAPGPSAKARRGRLVSARPGSFSWDIRMSSSDKKFSSGPSPGPTGKYASDMAGRAGRLGAPAQPGEPSRRACALPRPAPAGAAPLRPAPGGGKGAGPGLGGALPRGRAGTAAGVRPPHPCWPRRLAALGPGQARCRAKGRPGLGPRQGLRAAGRRAWPGLGLPVPAWPPFRTPAVVLRQQPF